VAGLEEGEEVAREAGVTKEKIKETGGSGEGGEGGERGEWGGKAKLEWGRMEERRSGGWKGRREGRGRKHRIAGLKAKGLARGIGRVLRKDGGRKTEEGAGERQD